MWTWKGWGEGRGIWGGGSENYTAGEGKRCTETNVELGRCTVYWSVMWIQEYGARAE